jgi:N-methylhydantoinase A
VYFLSTRRWHSAAVEQRGNLAAGETVKGPAIVEEEASCTVVPPEWRARVDDYGNLLMNQEAL